MPNDAIAFWAAGRIGVGPGVNSRVLRNMDDSLRREGIPSAAADETSLLQIHPLVILRDGGAHAAAIPIEHQAGARISLFGHYQQAIAQGIGGCRLPLRRVPVVL